MVLKRSKADFVVVVGRLAPVARRVVADDSTPAAALPTDVEILPFPRWETDAGTFVTDAESQRLCVEAFNAKRRKLVWDYEHQTLHDVEAPAAAWTPIGGLVAAGERGLRAKVEWTDRGGSYVAAKEYDYFSPVAIIEKSSNRVIALHSIALTNTPKTQDQTPLSEQIAAKALIEYEQLITAKEGGLMNELIERLIYFLNMATTSTFNQVRAEVQKILDVLPSTDDMVIAPATDTAAAKATAGDGKPSDDKPGAKTIMELVGLVVAKAKEAAATVVVASKDFLAELELPENATLAQVQAKVAALKFPANVVELAEHEKIVAKVTELEAEIATLKATGSKESLDQLIAANKAKLPPAKEAWFREVVAKHGIEHGREVLKNLEEVKPRQVAKDTAPLAPVVPIVAAAKSSARIAGKDIPVDEESLVIRAKVEAIQKEDPEKWGDYGKATAELRRRERAAK